MSKANKKSVKELFPGIMIGTESEVIENPFSGEKFLCTPEEVAVYDYLKGCELIQDYKSLRKGLEWFIENNSAAYMVLLD